MSKHRRILVVTALLIMLCLINFGAVNAAQREVALIKGKVTNQSGKPLGNVRIMAMHRSEHTEHEAKSYMDGAFVLEVTPGAYDISAKLDGYELFYTGPVYVDVSKRVSIVMRPVGQTKKGLVHGRITDRSGGNVPKGTEVKLVPNEGLKVSALRRIGPSRQTTTQKDGTFQFSNVPEGYFDLVVSIPGKKDEVIDIVKLDGPCLLDFRVGTPYPNEWQPGMHIEGAPSQFEALHVPSLKSSGCTVNPENPISVNGQTYLVLGCGTAKYTSTESVSELDTGNPCPIACWEITIAKNGAWWYDYGINVYNTVFSTSSGWISYRFTDGEPDTYTLSNFYQGPHKVSYNSKHPEVHNISYTWTDK